MLSKTSSAAATAAITNPVTFALCRGKLVTIAMKSPHGRGTLSQRATPEALLRAGAQLVGVPLGERCDVGAAQVWRAV
jgi:hypothetical protein